jgi:hypothetical protein
MVFAQAPCSPGRKKWRHGACLGLLPSPENGISDITQMYLQAFGEPEPGRKIFIRTRQQRNGWEGKATDLGALVPVSPLAARSRTAFPPARFPLSKPCRNLFPFCLADGLPTLAPPLLEPCHRPMRKSCTRDRHRASAGAPPLQYRSGASHSGPFRKVTPPLVPRTLPESRRTGHWRELWHGG